MNAITTARLLQWLKNVKPLVKCNAVDSGTTFDIYLLNELDALMGLVERYPEETNLLRVMREIRDMPEFADYRIEYGYTSETYVNIDFRHVNHTIHMMLSPDRVTKENVLMVFNKQKERRSDT